VAITPAAGYVSGIAPILIGLLAGVVCSYAVKLKHTAGYDDALDVVGVHFVGGLLGSLTIGFFANPDFFAGTFDEGLFYGGGLGLLGEQALANLSAIVWSFAITFGIMIVLKNTIGVRVSEEAEDTGLDLSEHAETAYH
jgi:Amt family ammonium transporter